VPLVPASDERAKSAKKLGLTSKLDDIDSIAVPSSQASHTAVNVSDQPSPMATQIPSAESYGPDIPMPSDDTYDSIIDGKQPDEYDLIIDGQRGAQKSSLQSSMYVGARAEPDRAAKVLALSQELNLPPRIVEEQYDKLSTKKKVIGTDYDAIIDNTPGLAKWLENPENAQIAHDDLDGLSAIEKTVQDHGVAWKGLAAFNYGATKGAAGLARIPNLLGAITYYPYNVYQEKTGGQQVQYPVSNPVADWLDKQADDYAAQTPEIGGNFAKEMAAGNYSRAGSILGYQFVGQLPQLAAVMASGGSSRVLTALGGMAAAERNKELAEQGVSPATAAPVAAASGAIEVGTEALGTFRYIDEIGKALVKRHGKQGALEVFKSMGKVMVSSGVQEGSEESAAAVGQAMLDYSTGVDRDAFKKLPENIVNQGVLGFALGGAGAGPAITVGAANKIAQQRQTTLAKEFYLSLGGSLEASKLRERLPQKQREFVEGLVAGSPVENIYVSPVAIESYFQGKGESAVKVMDELGVRQEYETAKDTGQDIKIPLGTWAEKFVADDHYKGLQNDIKFDPAALSVNEQKADDEQLKSDLEAEAKAAKKVDPLSEAGSAVVKDVEEQLKAINADPQQAVLYRGFEVLGRRAGIDPLELYNRYQLSIGRGESPAQAMSAAQGETLFQSDKPPAPPFYSRLTKTVEEKMGGSATPEQINGMLREIKPEERKWLGLDEFLKGKGKVGKEELLAHLRGNALEIKEVVKGGSEEASAIENLPSYKKYYDEQVADGLDADSAQEQAFSMAKGRHGGASDTEAAKSLRKEYIEQFGYEVGGAKYKTYTLPGGENYRELLFKLPESDHSAIEAEIAKNEEERLALQERVLGATQKLIQEGEDWMGARKLAVKRGLLTEQDLDRLEELNDRKADLYDQRNKDKRGKDFHASHFQEPNVLAHTRLNDRVDAEGKRVLFVEEIQSDWHQAGRKEGYKGEIINEDGDRRTLTGVPDAPFKKTWHEFVLKRLIREAAEKGYDNVAWTTGEQQAERYPRGGDESAKEAQLRGMQGFYDKILVDFANKFGKKYGAKVRGAEIPLGQGFGVNQKAIYTGKSYTADEIKELRTDPDLDATESNQLGGVYDSMKEGLSFEDAIAARGSPHLAEFLGGTLEFVKDKQGTEVHSLEITPALKKAALEEGFSLFQPGRGAPRGQISFGKSRQFNIDLLAGADESTFLHETGHFYLEVLGDLSDEIQAIEEGKRTDRQKQILTDYQSVLEFVGAKSRTEVTREMHEKWADAFEDYLHEGKAPTSRLREAFARFKAWLTMVYRVVQRNNVQLTPEVRGIMDRLLATEEEIEAAQSEMNQSPLFVDPKAMGMSDSMATKYLDATYWAKQHAIETVNAELLNHHERQRSKAWAEEREAIKPGIEAEVSQRQVYVAIDQLRDGKLPDGSPMKLSPLSVAEFGKDVAKTLPKGTVATKKSGQGLDVAVAAELLGYGSAQELITALSTAEDKAALIERLAEEEMRRRNPDMLEDARLPQEVMEAVHNQSRERMLRMELEHLASEDMPVLKEMIRRIAKRVPSEKEVKAQAREIIGRQKVGEIRPYDYQLAEARAAKEAGVLLAKGDFDGAFQAKRRELLNFELHRMAKAAEAQQDKAVALFKKLRQKDEDIAKSRDIDLVNAARAILARFGVGKADKSPESYLKNLKSYDPETYASLEPLVESATQNAAPIEELAFDDLVALYDGVKALWDISKAQREIEREGKKLELEKVVGELKARIEEKTGEKPQPGQFSEMSDQEKRALSIAGLANLATRVEHWAYAMDKGNPNGVFTKYIIRPILEATTRYRLKRLETLKALSEIVKTIKVEDPKAKIAAQEIEYTFTKPELIMALLHTGNESNLRKLLDGRGWGEVDEDGDLDRSRWDAFANRAMTSGIITKSDMDAVQAIWDLNEKLKPDAQKAHKEMFGRHFDEITANEVVTPWGTYRGGYMPAISDKGLSVDASVRESQQALDDTPHQMFPTTGRGFTKSRTERYTTPLSLDFGKLKNHLDKVLRFTYIEPEIKNATKIINNREFRSAMNRYDADAANGLLIPWLKRAATQRSTTPGLSKTLDGAAMTFRRSSSMQIMVLNVINAIQNATGLIPSLVRVDPKFMAGSFKRYMSGPKDYAATAIETSDYMRTRIGEHSHEFTREIDEFIVNPTKLEKTKEYAIKHGYFLDRLTNNMVELVVWGAAFEQAQAQKMSHRDAVAFADSTVRQAIAGMAPEDIARFESASPFVRLFTMFSSFFNTQANLYKAELAIAKEEGGAEGAFRATKATALIITVPAIVSALIFRLMAGKGLDEDDDGEYVDDFFDIIFGSQFRYMTAMVPGGQIINAALARFNNKPYDDKISLSPAFSSFEKALGSIESFPKAAQGRGATSKAIKDGAMALGLATGLPVAPVAKPLGYAADIAERRVKPSGPVDAARGAVTGYGSK
jgi:hypothetical protein